MAEVLSQSQIDALLNAIGSGDTEEVVEPVEVDAGGKKIKHYDFKTPKKFTRDRLKLVYSLYETFARIASLYLTSMMRINCNLEMVDIEEQRYSEFSNALSEADVVALVDPRVIERTFDIPVMLQMSNPLIYSMIDRMIGGTGDNNEGLGHEDTFTDIEVSLLENVLVHLLPIMEEAWVTYFDVNFRFNKVETNPRLIQSIQADEMVLIIVLNVDIKDTSGTLSICVPGVVMDEIFKQAEITERMNKRKEGNSEESKAEILDKIKDTPLEIKASLGEAIMEFGDVFLLKPGDVINLRKPKESDITLYIEEMPWYKGRLGEKKGNVAVKITGTTIARGDI